MFKYPLITPMILLAMMSGALRAEDVNTLLEKLETHGKALRSLKARSVLKTHNALTGETQTRIGDVRYLAADPEHKQPARFAIRFNQLIIDDAAHDRQLELLFDGVWLVEINYAKKDFIKRQLVPPGERIDPLRIDGPIPIPIGQPKDQVLARFDVIVIPEESAPGPVLPPLHLRLTPRKDAPKIEGRKSFEVVDMWIDRSTMLPAKIFTRDENGVNETTVILSNLEPNTLDPKELAAAVDIKPPAEGWRVEIMPWKK